MTATINMETDVSALYRAATRPGLRTKFVREAAIDLLEGCWIQQFPAAEVGIVDPWRNRLSIEQALRQRFGDPQGLHLLVGKPSVLFEPALQHYRHVPALVVDFGLERLGRGGDDGAQLDTLAVIGMGVYPQPCKRHRPAIVQIHELRLLAKAVRRPPAARRTNWRELGNLGSTSKRGGRRTAGPSSRIERWRP